MKYWLPLYSMGCAPTGCCYGLDARGLVAYANQPIAKSSNTKYDAPAIRAIATAIQIPNDACSRKLDLDARLTYW